jgi:hypothetical protein
MIEYGKVTHKKVKKTIETPIDCPFYNNLRLYKDGIGWNPARIFSYSHKIYKFCPFSYKKKVEIVYYRRKKAIYIDSDTGEVMEDYICRMIESVKYIAKNGYGIPTQVGGQKSMMTNKYKLNANHIIRKRNKLIHLFTEYYDSTLKGLVSQGYSIKHLVLTVKHTKEYGFRGSKFFHSEILKIWNLLRKDDLFKQYIYGGFTSSEVTKGKNGWHNHLHIMIIQNPNNLDIDVREYITKRWIELTGSDRVNYENLYKKIYLNNGKTRKLYLNSNTVNTIDLIKSFLEMIKYTVDLKDSKLSAKDIGNFLHESRYKRVFNRFGSLYGVKELNLNYKSNHYDSFTKKPFKPNYIDDCTYQDYTVYSSKERKLFKYRLLPVENQALLRDVYVYGYKILKILHECKNKIQAIRSIQSIKNKGKPIEDMDQNGHNQSKIKDRIPIYINGLVNFFDNVEL